MSLKSVLKRRREELGLTAKYVAKTLNIAPSTYFEWEQGRGISGEEFYIPLCKLMKVSLSELITGQDPSPEISTALDEIENRIKNIRASI